MREHHVCLQLVMGFRIFGFKSDETKHAKFIKNSEIIVKTFKKSLQDENGADNASVNQFKHKSAR